MNQILICAAFIGLAAALYSSVGHGGASGYLAAMSLFGLSPLLMKPAGLVLNLLVAGIAAVRFIRRGYFSLSVFLPLVTAAVPFAFIGGFFTLPNALYKGTTGLVLLFAAYKLLAHKERPEADGERPMRLECALMSGAGIGLLSGLIGVGGGIFLSPLLIVNRWAGVRETAGISAAFIWVNSLAGLTGHLSNARDLPGYLFLFAVVAVIGGLIGSGLGSRPSISPLVIRRLLSLVLVIASIKMIGTAW